MTRFLLLLTLGFHNSRELLNHQFKEDPARWRYWYKVHGFNSEILTLQGIVAALNQGNRGVVFCF
jgi:hypothetical protein